VVLVDSSAWIEVLRGALDLRRVVRGVVAVCPPVVQEVLQGARSEREYQFSREMLLRARMLEPSMYLDVFEEAAQLYRACRAAGFTIRSSHDCLVAVCAIRNDVPLLHGDSDFEHIARVSALRFA
jgi:predicted nucleic acid-binding protein